MSITTLQKLAEMRPPLHPGEPSWLADFRQRAWQDGQHQGLPRPKTEDWKYTSVRALLSESLLAEAAAASGSGIEIPAQLADREDLYLAVLVNGVLEQDLSSLRGLPAGLRLQSLHEAIAAENSDLASLFGNLVEHDRHPFAALNGAGFRDGLWIDLAPGLVLDKPLMLLWVTSGEQPQLSQPRLLLRLGTGSRLTLVEQHSSSALGHLINQLAEISLGDNADLTHLHLRQTGRDRLINGAHVRCQRDSRYRHLAIDLGGALVRSDLVIGIDGPGVDVTADGLFFATAGQHVDNHLHIDHRAPHGTSRALYKGLLARSGHGVFNGKLIVHPAGRKTDARQVNHNLLLTRGVEIDTKPELEIYNDDVKCSHGCTSGELDADQLFYLRSRGIGSEEAAALLVTAFAREISDRIDNESLRRLAEAAIDPILLRMTEEQESA